MGEQVGYGLPPDLQQTGPATVAKEYWHLPQSVWGPIHAKATGKGIVIANLDTGYNPHHPLIPTPLEARSFIPKETSPTDYHGHGSHTIGTCCGRSGLISPAPEAGLIVGKVLSKRGPSQANSVPNGIRWAADKGAHVISLSLGGDAPYKSMEDAVRYANSKGCVIVAAAGNAGYTRRRNTINWPARYDGTLCIGSYSKDGSVSGFSSGGRELDLACPGSRIVSCDRTGSGLRTMSGTSMATPFAAALCALVLELVQKSGARWPTGPVWWREFIAANTEDRGATGKDVRWGYGVPRYTDIIKRLSHDDLVWV